MNYKIFIAIFLFLYSCTTNNINVSNDKVIIQSETYSNKGFTLLFNEDLKKKKLINKKIEERSLIIFQKNLAKGTTVKITNLINNKSMLAKVGPKSDYPAFYNSVISKRIYNKLEIDIDEPYVEVLEISENSTFLAKKAKTFDEEKNVADKAPVEDISIYSLNNDADKSIKNKINNFSYIVKIADFYYEDTAKLMIKRIKSESKLININILKLSDINYRVYLGPFNDLKSLKKAFNDIKIINFENIEIIKT